MKDELDNYYYFFNTNPITSFNDIVPIKFSFLSKIAAVFSELFLNL